MVKRLIILASLMLCFSMCYSTKLNTDTNDGGFIILIAKSGVSSAPKTDAISASINGHYLNIVFTENLGEVTIKIFNEAGVALDLFMMGTPTGYQFYIPLAGRYTLVLDFADGDEYYGEFEVND